MNKSIFFFFLNFYSFLVFSSYSTPTLLLPTLCAKRSLGSFYVTLIFIAFPISAFPASLTIGKLMRFYRKDRLLLIFNTIASISRFSVGLLYFIEDSTLFFILAFLARLFTGAAEGALIPIAYSFIPELFPEEIMVKYGIMKFWGSMGEILGSPLSSLIYEELGYFAVFAIFGAVNFVIGMFIIVVFLGSESLVKFTTAEKNTLPLKDALFKNKAVLLNFFYLFMNLFPCYMIGTGFQIYLSTLTSSLTVSAIIYSCISIGMVLGIFGVKSFYKKNLDKNFLGFFGLMMVVALAFFGPDPIFGITDSVTKLVLIGVAFLAAGIAMEVIFLIIIKIFIKELLKVFPGENELCTDFANGLYMSCYTLDQFVAPIVGSSLESILGYDRTGMCYGMISLTYFVIYWVWRKGEEEKYENMVEEEETQQNTSPTIKMEQKEGESNVKKGVV